MGIENFSLENKGDDQEKIIKLKEEIMGLEDKIKNVNFDVVDGIDYDDDDDDDDEFEIDPESQSYKEGEEERNRYNYLESELKKKKEELMDLER